MTHPRLFLFFMVFVFLVAVVSRADDGSWLYVQPEAGYHAPRIFTQSQTAGYSGFDFGGSIYYKIGDEDFAFAPVVSYTYGDYDSTANTSARQEKLTEHALTAGVKLYFGRLFLRAGYAWVRAEDRSTGTNAQSLSDSTHSLSGAVGVAIPLSKYVNLEVSADVENGTFGAKPGGFTSDSQLLRFGGTLGIGILLPSEEPKRSSFRSISVH